MWTSSEKIKFQVNDITKNGEMIDDYFLLTLISRRNRRRQGPRSVLFFSFSILPFVFFLFNLTQFRLLRLVSFYFFIVTIYKFVFFFLS